MYKCSSLRTITTFIVEIYQQKRKQEKTFFCLSLFFSLLVLLVIPREPIGPPKYSPLVLYYSIDENVYLGGALFRWNGQSETGAARTFRCLCGQRHFRMPDIGYQWEEIRTDTAASFLSRVRQNMYIEVSRVCALSQYDAPVIRLMDSFLSKQLWIARWPIAFGAWPQRLSEWNSLAVTQPHLVRWAPSWTSALVLVIEPSKAVSSNIRGH